jgi:hypothetical protein
MYARHCFLVKHLDALCCGAERFVGVHYGSYVLRR